MDHDNETDTRLRSLKSDGDLMFDPETEAFLKEEIKIQDTEELKNHILGVQEEGYKIFPYLSLRGLRSAQVKISKMPAYPRVLRLLEARPDAVFLEIGCCLGTDVRKIIQDGWPISQTIATDIEGGFWDLGHKLFRTTPDTYPAKFLAVNALDDVHFDPTAPISSGPPPSVASVKTLTELRQCNSVIYTSSVFHIFTEDDQFKLSKRLAALLDPRPGSIIFGSHAGMPRKGQRNENFPHMFCHSLDSWTQMWEEQIFDRGQVKVAAALMEVDMTADMSGGALPAEGGAKFYLLAWSVERL